MFRKGGSANEGIMHGLENRSGYAGGGTIGGGNIQGTPMGYRTGFQDPTWDSMTPTDWENIAKAYGMSGVVSTDYEDPKNIEKWSQPVFEWWNQPSQPSTLLQSIYDEAKEAKKYPDLSETIMEKGPPGGTQLPYVKPREEDNGNKLEKIRAKKETMSEKNKRYMEMMAPGMQKRMINDALAAASEAFGTSTGDTKQDIANAISAAAKGMGGTKDLYDKISMLTLQGEIAKDIEAAKPYKPNATETLIALGMSKDPEKKALFKTLSKGGDTVADLAMEFSKKYQTKGAERGLGDAYQLKASSANAKNYGGTLDLTTDGKTADFEKMVKGQIYYNYLDLNFYAIGDDGKPKQVAKPDYLK